MFRFLAGVATSTFVLCLATAASAQTTAPPAPQADTQSGSQQAIGDIIVTASRHSVSLQRESREISAVTQDDLTRNGVADPANFNLVPGVSIAKNGSQVQVYVRGVGDRSVNAFGDPAVASSLDGVFIPRGFALGGLFFDLDRIEVVKGPQGTLYGRNATAGALNLVSAKPGPTLSAYADGEIGNFGTQREAVGVNVPIADGLAVRAAGQIDDHNGYLSDGTNDARSRSARLAIGFRPNSDFSLTLNATYSHQGGKGPGPVIKPEVGGQSFVGAADPRSTALLNTLDPANAYYRPGTDVFLDTNTWLLSATLDWRIAPGVRLTVLPGYVYSSNNSRNYASQNPYNELQISSQKSFEARLSSDGSSRLDWVVGGYVAREDASDDSNFGISKAVSVHRIFPKLDDFTWAAFGEAKFSIVDGLRLIGGLRYTWEKKEIDGTTQTTIAGRPGAVGAIPGSLTFDSVNYRAGVEYDVSDHVMLFGTVSTGFKAGGFFGALPPNTYRPEKLTSYEAGIKSRFLDNKLQVNLDLFYWDYRDRQESFVGVVTGGATALITTNAGSARLYGGDLSIVALPSPHDRLTFDAEYLNSRYNDYVFNTNTTAVRTGCAVGPSTDPRLQVSVNCSGFELVRAPKWTGRGSYQHRFALGGGRQILLDLQTRFSAPYWLANDFLPSERVSAYHVSDAMLTFQTAEGRFEAGPFVRNIENHMVYSLAAQSSGINGLILGFVQAPRTYGMRARVKF